MVSLAVAHSRALRGLTAPAVRVEVHLANGLPLFNIVGLPETSVRESRERVRAALLQCGFEFPHRRITVNLIQPGPTDTDMNPADGPYADWMRNQMAIPEFGRGADVAKFVAWVASEESRFVTGAALTIDGGMSI